ncbi:Arabinose efflux permease family protein [Frankia canadensis]|uniref:Arabinose efflux permease family protein n=1 Tax=Frankia canadensis TaxID=1836972 RepID=A0A2I2KUL5_9ACTN|nr:MFS transporter [Frankia canadensis]SNQ49367.1 Arabinose efflux permease family protein [Frankia canadensis]SOU56657.1 Arabinose efflux permease family protein [Frankia canadensis]
MPPDTGGEALRGWQLGLLAAGTFTLGVDAFVLAGLLPTIADDLHVRISTAGQLTTIFSITYAVGSPVIAALTGRWDRRVLLGAGLALFLLGMAGQALAPSYAVMAAGRAVAAIGAAAFQSNAYVMAGVLAGPERRGRALAAVTAGTSLSTVLGVPFGVLVGQTFSWRAVLWTIAALAAVTAVLVPRLPKAHVPPTSLRTRLGVLIRPPVLVLLVTTVLVVASSLLLVIYLPVVLGMDEGDRRLVVVLLAFGVGSIAGNRLVGRLVDSRGALGVLLVGMAGVGVSYAVMVGVRTWFVPALAVAVAVGAFGGLTITPQQHRLFAVAPDVSTVALGLNGSAIYLGAALGAALGGVALDAVGAWAVPATAALLAAAALALIVLGAPERRSRSRAIQPAPLPTRPATPPMTQVGVAASTASAASTTPCSDNIGPGSRP